jgi:hypothetical protein
MLLTLIMLSVILQLSALANLVIGNALADTKTDDPSDDKGKFDFWCQ